MRRLAAGRYTGEINGRAVRVTRSQVGMRGPYSRGFSRTPEWYVVDALTGRVLADGHQTMSGAIKAVTS